MSNIVYLLSTWNSFSSFSCSASKVNVKIIEYLIGSIFFFQHNVIKERKKIKWKACFPSGMKEKKKVMSLSKVILIEKNPDEDLGD